MDVQREVLAKGCKQGTEPQDSNVLYTSGHPRTSTGEGVRARDEAMGWWLVVCRWTSKDRRRRRGACEGWNREREDQQLMRGKGEKEYQQPGGNEEKNGCEGYINQTISNS